MVKCRNNDTVAERVNQGKNEGGRNASKIGPNTPYAYCSQQLSSFGGLSALTKFLDLTDFEKVVQENFHSPKRKPALGCYQMLLGVLMLLFIGFNRMGHFLYVREDPMLCGILKVPILPVVSTFWRFIGSLGMNQARSLLRITGILRCRIWQLSGIAYKRIRIDIDTTVTTVYGNIDGSRKGHNTRHRGKKGLRPVLCFIAETREYICGSQRRGTTITNEEVAKHIKSFNSYLPSCVKKVLVTGDGEFIGAESVAACEEKEFEYIFGNKVCNPPFPDNSWYRSGEHEYNECEYQPQGWEQSARFVVMRIPKKKKKTHQLSLFDDDYKYRIFVTNLATKPHNVIRCYDKRADCENLIGESQREGITAIPSRRFQTNYAYFQIVMLAYNIWRWMKLLAGCSKKMTPVNEENEKDQPTIVDNTIRIARLKMLYLPSKIVSHANQSKIYYSVHDTRAPGLITFLKYLDERRNEEIVWHDETRLMILRRTG